MMTPLRAGRRSVACLLLAVSTAAMPALLLSLNSAALGQFGHQRSSATDRPRQRNCRALAQRRTVMRRKEALAGAFPEKDTASRLISRGQSGLTAFALTDFRSLSPIGATDLLSMSVRWQV